jgi:hypothetical protein
VPIKDWHRQTIAVAKLAKERKKITEENES